ncbi:MAG: hypothetical protein IKY72_02675 [Bacteroidaceae bacterium]|nr:hypothetical protein [Bacteroidaceae bacterium]
MKRTIFTALCALMTLGASAQTEKVMRVHMTDGTVKEYHVGALRDFSFTGLAVVSDDDYTQISQLDLVMEGYEINFDITANFGFDDPYITGSRYGQDWGILYSTSPDVTVENGTLVELEWPLTNVDELSSHRVSFRLGESVRDRDNYYNDEGVLADLEYATTYYFRSFVYRPAIGDLYEEQYFYSAVKSVALGYPPMRIYGASILPDYVAEKGYVFPSSSAWREFDEQYPYFEYHFDDHWNDYLTPERHEALKAQCTTVYECAEGKLYLLDVVGEEFLQYLLDIYATEFVADLQTAVLDEASSTEATYVECDASWGVPGNGYWKYTAAAKKNPFIELTLPKRMMRNYNYKIEITLAPNTEAEETLPSKVSARLCPMWGGTVDLASKFETSVSECSVITLEGVKVNNFIEAGVEIESVMNHSNRGGEVGKFLPILRVAQVKVIPMGPVE